ncbi:hypothetical protein AB0I24_15585 [Brachybacterium paraconglomeratum]
MVKVLVGVFAVIGLGATGVFAYGQLTGGGDERSEPMSGLSAPTGDGFVADLEFTPGALRAAVEDHGVRCDGGWQDDENGAQVCAGESGYYAVLAEPIERMIDGYVSGPLLEEDPDQYVIATTDAALIVPGDDAGWLYKVSDDCAECFGWGSASGREAAVAFTAGGLKEVADSAVGCVWSEHNLGLSTCVYVGDTGGDFGVNVFEEPTDDLLNEMHGPYYTTIVGDRAALQFQTEDAWRFVTPPTMRACQLAGPCLVKIGDGDVWEFDPATPGEVDDFFSARSSPTS